MSDSLRLTRWGESSVYGFLPFLEHSDSVQILLQSITTEAREQMVSARCEVFHHPEES